MQKTVFLARSCWTCQQQ